FELPVRPENVVSDGPAGGAVLLHDLPMNHLPVVAGRAPELVVVHFTDLDLIVSADLAILTRLHVSLLEEASDVRRRETFLGPAHVPEQRGLDRVGTDQARVELAQQG